MLPWMHFALWVFAVCFALGTFLTNGLPSWAKPTPREAFAEKMLRTVAMTLAFGTAQYAPRIGFALVVFGFGTAFAVMYAHKAFRAPGRWR